jgi:hypothetical protein
MQFLSVFIYCINNIYSFRRRCTIHSSDGRTVRLTQYKTLQKKMSPIFSYIICSADRWQNGRLTQRLQFIVLHYVYVVCQTEILIVLIRAINRYKDGFMFYIFILKEGGDSQVCLVK